MPETTSKFLSRCLLYTTCNHGLVVNFGNIKTEEKQHDLNLTITVRRLNKGYVSAHHRL